MSFIGGLGVEFSHFGVTIQPPNYFFSLSHRERDQDDNTLRLLERLGLLQTSGGEFRFSKDEWLAHQKAAWYTFFLLEHGADRTVKDMEKGLTPSELALSDLDDHTNRYEVIQLLSQPVLPAEK
jgi:hypothetical protein